MFWLDVGLYFRSMAETPDELLRSTFATFLGGLAAAFVGGASSIVLGASLIGGSLAIAGTAVVLTSAVRILGALQGRGSTGSPSQAID